MSLILYLTRIHFADHVLEDALAEEMRRLAMRRPVIVLDGDGGRDGLAARLADALPSDCAPVRTVMTGADGAIADDPHGPAGHRADGVIGFGGRPALDVAGRLAATASHGAAVPWIAVPTTADPVALDAARCPCALLCDPTLTRSMDPAATARAGMDALSHCIGAYLATSYNPPADGIALEGVRRAALWIERAFLNGADAEARREMMAAALNAALAAQKGLGGAEAISRAVEAAAGLGQRHGALHAALLPPLLEFNAPAVGARYGAIRAAMQAPPGCTLPCAVGDLGARIGLPRGISFLKQDSRTLDRAAEAAAADPANRSNPRHATPVDYRRLLRSAL